MASAELLNNAAGILTEDQEKFLQQLSQEPYFCERYYFTGGTPLSAFYLYHRLSEDIDLFSEEEVYLPSIQKFLKKIQQPLGIQAIDYRQFMGLHSFQLCFSKSNILKVDFNYYPFSRIEKGGLYKDVSVDSLLDIAVNKVHTISTKPRARDFIDVYFILKEYSYDFNSLIKQAKIKFDWHIDTVQFGSRLYLAREATDFPRMIKNIDHHEWQEFFVHESAKLKNTIFE